MKHKDYKKFVEAVWVSDGQDERMQLAIAGLGLGGESGEVTEHIKKFLRGTHDLNKDEIALELGDVLYYIYKVSNILGLDVQDIRQRNVDKLSKRYLEKRGKEVEYGDE